MPAPRSAGGVHEAYRQLIRTGCCHSTPEVALEQLRSIRDFLGTTDPLMLGAAFLLEQAGCERSHEILALFDERRAGAVACHSGDGARG